jgi:hypothetical protein
MATSQDIPFTVSPALSGEVISYLNNIRNKDVTPMNDYRSMMEKVDLAYARELDLTDATIKARLAHAKGDITKIPNMQIPIVKPQVESAVTYLTSVFLTGYPIFGVVGGPDNQSVAEEYNAVLTDQSIHGGWARQIELFFRDGLKYNIHGLKVAWETHKIYNPTVDPLSNDMQPTEELWKGNVLKRMDMYNTFYDWRVSPSDVHTDGEYVGYHEIKSRIKLKEFITELAYKSNIKEAFNSSFATDIYFTPKVNNSVWTPSNSGDFNWDLWLGYNKTTANGVKYSGSYVVTHLYARIVPADFGMSVPARGNVQIWYFIVINGKHCIYAERQTNLHRHLPIIIGQPNEDGLGLQTKAFADDLRPYQEIATALWNGRLASARRRISDRMFYNPRYVKKADINSPESTAKIPVSLPAYNGDIRTAVMQIPFEDSASGTFSQEVGAVMEFSFFSSGQNRVSQGQFQKGNKTQKEFNDTMGNANGRNQSMAIKIENQVFAPVKEILKLNILQFQEDAAIYDPQANKEVQVKASDLRKKAIAFKMTDGLTPSEKLLSTEEWAVALQTIQSVPSLQAGYETVPMFSHLMSIRGTEGLEKFEKSPAMRMYEQQMASWQQVAIEASKAGQQPPPQPQPSPELQQEMQEKQAKFQAKQTGTPTGPQQNLGV